MAADLKINSSKENVKCSFWVCHLMLIHPTACLRISWSYKMLYKMDVALLSCIQCNLFYK